MSRPWYRFRFARSHVYEADSPFADITRHSELTEFGWWRWDAVDGSIGGSGGVIFNGCGNGGHAVAGVLSAACSAWDGGNGAWDGGKR